jgi:hypothetical protein
MPESESLWGILYDLGALRCSCRQPESRNLDLRDEGQGAAAGTGKEAAPCGSNEGLECSMGSCVLSAVLLFPGVSGEKMRAGRVMSPYITFGSFKNRADGTDHGAELDSRLFQARFLIRLPAIKRWVDR